MSILSNAIRPFWIRDLHTVCGRPRDGVAAWVKSTKGWQVISAPKASSFSLTVSDHQRILDAYAADTSRMAISALESIGGVYEEKLLSKSTAWLVIRGYYSAYFAAHAVMRMTGSSCTKLEEGAIRAISRVAAAYGFAPLAPMQDGYYQCTLNSLGQLNGQKIAGNSGGSHLAFWNAFREHLIFLSTEVLKLNSLPQDQQSVSTKLSEIIRSLEHGTDPKKPSAAFLTNVRNSVNYRGGYGCWFPYTDRLEKAPSLFRSLGKWRDDPMTIKTQNFGSHDLERFVCTCSFLIGMCRNICSDMYQRCPEGKSFHHFSTHALLSFIK